ncbi:MAG TPA: regulatory iron-sulfur-containing complex subunit RicT [Bacteroidales bacterium]|nr:regulatory iron-sulfur-containing complex subunit RicT [Bacteroidales bacterium]
MTKKVDINNPLFSRGCTCLPLDGEPSPYSNGCAKFSACDYLSQIPASGYETDFEFAEIRLKNNHKEFMHVQPDIKLQQGDIVLVEGNPGHDIGIVSLTGHTARLQMKAKNIDPEHTELKRVLRLAKPNDIEKWAVSSSREETTMLQTRKIVENLKLSMKINDVEYQGDGSKAIFYYTADERVDFRELIKILADRFKIRVEMRQIGIRQEAGKLGGIGPCGRELCCCSWINRFHTVSTQAAKIQQLVPNPQKLTGQCGKLKCCLNYEHEAYMDALKEFPDIELVLKTQKGEAICQKIDVFKKLMWYAYLKDPNNFLAIPLDKVKEIEEMNLAGQYPENLEDYAMAEEPKSFYEQASDYDLLNENGPDE